LKYYNVGEFAPLSAYLGGFVAQEVVKSLTNKFMPIRQLYYTDCVELLSDEQPEASLTGRRRSINQLIGGELQ
jgi:molybdopterin/thiamine biosynthesis adenylyltransferase